MEVILKNPEHDQFSNTWINGYLKAKSEATHVDRQSHSTIGYLFFILCPKKNNNIIAFYWVTETSGDSSVEFYCPPVAKAVTTEGVAQWIKWKHYLKMHKLILDILFHHMFLFICVLLQVYVRAILENKKLKN